MAEPPALTVFHGDTLVHVRARAIAVSRVVDGSVRATDAFDVDRPVARLSVAASGAAVIGFDRMHERAWLWRPGLGVRELARATGPRSAFAFALVHGRDRLLLLSSRDGELRGETLDGELVFAADTRAPHAFFAHSFAELGRGRLGIVGRTFGDSSDTAITVAVEALLGGPRAIQDALDADAPLIDRAARLAVGRCGDDAIVFRDPEDDEPADHEIEDLPDVWRLHGFYVRGLASGALVATLPYTGAVPSGAKLVATGAQIAVETPAGVVRIDRATGRGEPVGGRASALDPLGARIATLDDAGTWTVRALDDRASAAPG